jgi:hypothetical protein
MLPAMLWWWYRKRKLLKKNRKVKENAFSRNVEIPQEALWRCWNWMIKSPNLERGIKNIEKPDDVKLSGFLFYLFFNHSNNRLASSSLNNCVPSFIVCWSTSNSPTDNFFQTFVWDKAQTMPPTILSPAPTVLFFSNIGSRNKSYESLLPEQHPVQGND